MEMALRKGPWEEFLGLQTSCVSPLCVWELMCVCVCVLMHLCVCAFVYVDTYLWCLLVGADIWLTWIYSNVFLLVNPLNSMLRIASIFIHIYKCVQLRVVGYLVIMVKSMSSFYAGKVGNLYLYDSGNPHLFFTCRLSAETIDQPRWLTFSSPQVLLPDLKWVSVPNNQNTAKCLSIRQSMKNPSSFSPQ